MSIFSLCVAAGDSDFWGGNGNVFFASGIGEATGKESLGEIPVDAQRQRENEDRRGEHIEPEGHGGDVEEVREKPILAMGQEEGCNPRKRKGIHPRPAKKMTKQEANTARGGKDPPPDHNDGESNEEKATCEGKNPTGRKVSGDSKGQEDEE